MQSCKVLSYKEQDSNKLQDVFFAITEHIKYSSFLK